MTEPAKSEQETKICSTHNIRMYHPECSRCRGDGEVEDDDDGMFYSRPHFQRCYSCGGSGSAPWLECELCVQDWQDQENEYWQKQEQT